MRSRSANFLHKLSCSETVQFARASPGSEVIPRGGERFTHYQTLYQSLPELRSSERDIAIDRHPDRTEIYFRLQIVIESSSLVSVNIREV